MGQSIFFLQLFPCDSDSAVTLKKMAFISWLQFSARLDDFIFTSFSFRLRVMISASCCCFLLGGSTSGGSFSLAHTSVDSSFIKNSQLRLLTISY